MRKMYLIPALAAAIMAQSSFANDASSDSQACHTVAKACMDAGFVKPNSADKRFWQDCMKPVILGKTISGITVDAATAKQCREDKLAQLKQELQDFQAQ